MNKHEFTQLSELLPKVVNQYNLTRQVQGAVVCHQFRKIAERTWDEMIKENVGPISYKDGVLTVAVINSGWAQQVQFKQVMILEALTKACSEYPVKRIRVRVDKNYFA